MDEDGKNYNNNLFKIELVNKPLYSTIRIYLYILIKEGIINTKGYIWIS